MSVTEIAFDDLKIEDDSVDCKFPFVGDIFKDGYSAHTSLVGHCAAVFKDDDEHFCLVVSNENIERPPLLLTTENTQKLHRQKLQFIRSMCGANGLKSPIIKLVDDDSLRIAFNNIEIKEVSADAEEVIDDDDLTDAKKMFNSIVIEGIQNGASDFDIGFNPKASYYAFSVGGKMTPRKSITPENAKLMINAMFNTESENMTGSLEDEQIIDKNLNVMVTIPKENGDSSNESVRLRAEKCYAHNGYTLSVRIIRTEQSDDFSLKELGFEPEQLDTLKYLLKTPTGIILIVGPTGHGKSVTLKAFYEEMDPEWKIVVIEDPVEYIIGHPNCTQRPVVPEKGLTVKRHLKSTLRQFPKVIGISEIRDHEVAEDVINISLSGHKMVATMHANDSLAVLTRLTSLGVSYQVQAQDNLFSATMSQRLLPKLCGSCKQPSVHPVYGDIYIKKQGGCETCKGKGHKGVVLAAEVVVIDSTIRRLLNENKFNDVLPYLRSKGWRSIKDVGISKVKAGLVDPNEMFKALGDENNNENSEFDYNSGQFNTIEKDSERGE